jgi:peptide/nickel transport system substrate-binding protein
MQLSLSSRASIFIRRLAVAVLLLTGLAAQGAELRIGLAADVTSLDPHHINIGSNNSVLWHLYDALTHVNADARLIPGLALSWHAVDATTWEFKLRPGVKFHDGSSFTAEDVIASINRARAMEKSGGQFAGFTRAITGMQAVGPLTIRFKTAASYALLPSDLNSIFIIGKKDQAATSEDFNAGRIDGGTGPFKLAGFRRGDRIDLARNDAYWGGPAAWDRVSLRILPGDGTRIAALLAGDVDMIENIPTSDAARLKADPRFHLAQKVSWRTLFFHLDQWRDQAPGVSAKDGKPLPGNPFKDLRVRQAISKAINRGALVDRVMEGMAVPASNLVAPPVFGYAAALKPEPVDIDGAKKLLAAAGYPDGFAMTVAAPNNRYVNDEQVAQAVAQMLTRAGIAAKVDAMPVNVYLGRARKGDFSFAMLGWGSFAGDLALRSLLATPNPDKGYGTWNWGHYSAPALDHLLDRGFAATDEKKREALAIEAATLAMKDYGAIPLYHQIASWAMKKNLDYVARTDEFTYARDVKPVP